MQNESGKFILVVDDSVDNQNLLETLLISAGYTVHCASNGIEALSVLRELRQLPALILLDALMPLMDGYQFRREQLSDPALRAIPVVVMSGDCEMDIVSKMLQPCQVLSKPLDIVSLINSISRNKSDFGDDNVTPIIHLAPTEISELLR